MKGTLKNTINISTNSETKVNINAPQKMGTYDFSNRNHLMGGNRNKMHVKSDILFIESSTTKNNDEFSFKYSDWVAEENKIENLNQKTSEVAQNIPLKINTVNNIKTGK